MKLIYSIREGIGTITLSNPPYNTLLHPVFEERSRLESFLSEPELKAVVIKGDGRHFCAGADPGALRSQNADQTRLASLISEGKSLLAALSSATVPVLSLIRGSCLGAGLEIALSCHFRFASRNAMIGFPEVTYGFMPGFGGTFFGPRAAGRSAIIDLMLSGRMIRGEEAREIGIVDECAPSGEMQERGERFLKSLTSGRSPRLIRAVMTSINNAGLLAREEALREETSLFCGLVRETVDESQ